MNPGQPVDCPMCGNIGLQIAYTYDTPPKGETRFAGQEGESYWREMYRCNSCGHFREHFRMDQSQLYSGEYIDATYGDSAGIKRRFDQINALPPAESDNVGRVEFILTFCADHWNPAEHSQRRPRLLDVGAGIGVFPFKMKSAGWECTAIDVDERLVAHLNENVGVDGHLADLRSFESPSKFDLITFNKVLEHVPEPVRALSNCSRLLESTGIVYVELPDGEAAQVEGKEREEFLVGHIHVFSFASFALLVRQAGLELLCCERLCEPSKKYTLRGFARLKSSERQ